MRINPVTISMSQHDLDLIYAVARKALDKLTPGSAKYESLEWAVLSLADELHAATARMEERKTTIADLEGKF